MATQGVDYGEDWTAMARSLERVVRPGDLLGDIEAVWTDPAQLLPLVWRMEVGIFRVENDQVLSSVSLAQRRRALRCGLL